MPGRTLARRALLSVGLLALGFLVFAACSDVSSHAFIARRYVEGRDCLESSAAVDVVTGPDPGVGCGPKCLVGTGLGFDAGSIVYIAYMCPPDPPTWDESGTDTRCPKALASEARRDTCTGDAGSSNPAVDAGPADASSE
jgi:hypothetical protein